MSKTDIITTLTNLVPTWADVHYLCFGTDRSTGDSLGPLVGTLLTTQYGFTNVTGTIDEPCHAQNCAELHATIPPERFIIAIDACLGQLSSVGQIQLKEGPMRPGAGVGKDIGKFGQMHIIGIVNVGGFMEYFVLQNTRLSVVMAMAREIAHGIAIFEKSRGTMFQVAAATQEGVIQYE